MRQASIVTRVVVLATALVVAACSNTAAPSSTGLSGSIADARGDAFSDATVPSPPDLTGATVQVNGTTLVAIITFATGTLQPSQVLAQLLLDTDESSATGSPGVDSGGNDATFIGVDYLIDINTPRSSGQVSVKRAVGVNQFSVVGAATATFSTPDQIRVEVPLTLLGGDDGRVRFAVDVSQWTSDTTVAGVLDYMPDRGQPKPVTR